MNEIKKTRLKFFFVTAGIIFIMIATFCSVILINTHIRNRAFTMEIINHSESDFAPPKEPGKVIIRLSDRAGFEDMRAKEFNRLLWTTLTIGACSVISLTTFVWFLSFWVVKPAKQGFEKQRRFIQEASHELRTPLTVISTGIDLLSKRNSELNGGENATANGGRKNGEKAEKNGKNNKIDKNNAENDTEKWLNNIKEQTVKMATMTNDLLTLSRLSETEKVTKAEFNISKTISGEITAFECVAFENGKQIIDDIDTGLYYNGNENAVRQAAAILLDNAIKHSAERSNIEVTLIKNKHITLTVANDSELNANELPFIFERFYRGSESRAKTIGTGLGLAILKNTAEKNGWQIDVKITGHNKLTLTIIF